MKKRSMSKLKRPVLPLALLVLTLFCRSTFAQEYAKPKVSTAPADARTIVVNLVALEQCIHHNRLGAKLPEGQIYALANDVIHLDCDFDDFGNDKPEESVAPAEFEHGKVRLKSYKRPRPIVIRASKGDILEIRFRNLLPDTLADGLKGATVDILGLQWLKSDNDKVIQPGESHTYKYFAANEGVFMLMSPNGSSIPSSHNDYGLFGAVNVQPEQA